MHSSILLVDDEDTILFAMREYLQAEGYQVEYAQQLEAAKAAVARHRYAVVITDLRLSGSESTEGLELVSYLRSHCPMTRIILLTAYGSSTIEQEARRRGVDVFLQKLTPLPEVARFVRELLANEEAHLPDAAPSPLPSPFPPTILVIDDQDEALLSTQLLLEQEGYHVLIASSGREALALFHPGRVQVVIVDYFMPGMNGEELVREIRRRDADVQILLQTGYSGEKPPRQMLRELDIQGYHDKLDGPEHLLLWVEAALKTAAQLQKIKAAEHALAVSHNQLRRLSARLFRLQEEERTQISRELHDHLGQLHAAIAMDVEWAQRRCPSELQALREPLQEAFQLVQEAQQATRTLCARLRSGELRKLGLTAALQEYAADFARRSGVMVHFRDENMTMNELPTETAITVYRITQEALTNVVRHAAATEVIIAARQREDTCEIEIRDNGRGFLFSPNTPTSGLGIVGMQERARLMGGVLQIRSAPGTGATVVVRLPLLRGNSAQVQEETPDDSPRLG